MYYVTNCALKCDVFPFLQHNLFVAMSKDCISFYEFNGKPKWTH